MNEILPRPELLEAAASSYRALLKAGVVRQRVLAGGEWTKTAFQYVDGSILKIGVVIKTSDVYYSFAAGEVEATPPVIDVGVGFATEEDLTAVKLNGDRKTAAAIDALLKLRNAHAAEIAKPAKAPAPAASRARVFSLTRDGTGRLSGGVVTEM